jgi:hypothetical protein
MNTHHAKRGLSLAAIFLSASHVMALTKAQENTENLMENWGNFSRYGTDSLEGVVENAMKTHGGVDVKHRNEAGDTLLHRAAENGDAPVVKLLLKNGAYLGARNKQGQSALALARKILAEVEGARKAYTQQGKKVPLYIEEGIKKYEATIAVLEQAKAGAPQRTDAGLLF